MLRLSRSTPATLAVLRRLVAAEDATWGLRLVSETGRPAGTVYPILARLEAGGWVRSSWDDSTDRGPRRRLYELTVAGRDSAAALLAQSAELDVRPAAARRVVAKPA